MKMKKIKDEMIELVTHINGEEVKTGKFRHDQIFEKDGKYHYFIDGEFIAILDNPHYIND